MDKQISTYVDDDVYDKVREIASSNGLTIAAFMRMELFKIIRRIDEDKALEKAK